MYVEKRHRAEDDPQPDPLEPLVKQQRTSKQLSLMSFFRTKHPKLMWSYVFLQQYLPLCVVAMFDGGCSESKLSLLTNYGEHGRQSQLLTNPRGVNEIGC